MAARPFPYAGSRALITGASMGLGADFARALAARGCSLVLVARSRARLEALAGELCQAHGVDVEVIAQDLTAAGAAEAVVTAATASGRDVDILVNNAGFGSFGPFAALPRARELAEVQLNVAALVELTHALLPAMQGRCRGAIVQVASTAAFQPLPYLATYAATKAFVLSFSEALWAEGRGSGVRVVALCPGPTATDFFDNMGGSALRNAAKAPPADVVRCALRAVDRDACYAIFGARNFFLAHAGRLLPRALMARAAAWVTRPRA